MTKNINKMYLSSAIISVYLLMAATALCQEIMLTVTKDAYIDQIDANTNFGNEDKLIAQRDSHGRKIYFQFNASQFTNEILDIKSFEFDYAGKYGRYSDIYIVTAAGADNWDESTITWNNAPANDTQSSTDFISTDVYHLGQVNITGYGEYGTVELLWKNGDAKQAVIDRLNSPSRTITFAIQRTGDQSVQYHSKEAAEEYHPIRMAVEMKGYQGCPDITNDGIINTDDLAIMIDQWLETNQGVSLAADLSSDQQVLFDDYSILANSWQKAPPFPLHLYTYPMTNEELLDAFNLDLPELSEVKGYYQQQDFASAVSSLADYYRNREGTNWWFDPHQIDPSVGNSSTLNTSYDIMNGTWSQVNWKSIGEPDWLNYNYDFMPRMYFLSSLGAGYWYSGTEYPAAHAFIKVLRSWVNQVGPENTDYWGQMTTGIRMRSGWSDTFNYFLHSPIFTDQDMMTHIKICVKQLRYLRNNMTSNVPNHLAFARAGLYAGGVLFHELKEAQDWREYAIDTTVQALREDHLPDGASLELSVGYSQFFITNYLESIYDLAILTGRENEGNLNQIITEAEKAGDFFVRLMTPDRMSPSYNNNTGPDVVSLMNRLIDKYPHRQDFLWIATNGQQGTIPDYTSCFLPYTGYAVMRSSWSREANYLGFINSMTGRTHCHMDKLNIVLWAYGRQMIFESEGSKNDNSDPWSVYSQDTFSHNTGLVDNRPQRRKWGSPNPTQMPYQPLDNVAWVSNDDYDYAWGVYDQGYGMQGPSDSYPYSTGSNFYDGWVAPAHHYRKVLFLKPDIFIINDFFVTQDNQSHEYELRFNIKSTATRAWNTNWLYTYDNNQPNLEVIPLKTEGLTTNIISGQTSPQLMGWFVDNNVNAQRATTIQYKKTGDGTVQFLTLLMPREASKALRISSVNKIDENNYQIPINDGRIVNLQVNSNPFVMISASFE